MGIFHDSFRFVEWDEHSIGSVEISSATITGNIRGIIWDRALENDFLCKKNRQ